MQINCTLTAILINGVPFEVGMPLSEYEPVLGRPSRLDDGGPAPYGHRNNQTHFFDHTGVFLREHHLTRLIKSIGIVLEPEQAYEKPLYGFTGELVVCDVNMSRGMRPEAFLEQCAVPFRWHLGHSLVFDAETISIDIDTYAERTRSGRKSRRRVISVVSVGFRDAHLLSEAAKWNLTPEKDT